MRVCAVMPCAVALACAWLLPTQGAWIQDSGCNYMTGGESPRTPLFLCNFGQWEGKAREPRVSNTVGDHILGEAHFTADVG